MDAPEHEQEGYYETEAAVSSRKRPFDDPSAFHVSLTMPSPRRCLMKKRHPEAPGTAEGGTDGEEPPSAKIIEPYFLQKLKISQDR